MSLSISWPQTEKSSSTLKSQSFSWIPPPLSCSGNIATEAADAEVVSDVGPLLPDLLWRIKTMQHLCANGTYGKLVQMLSKMAASPAPAGFV